LLLLFVFACARTRQPFRLLVVGWDGATWDVIDPLVQQGRLPHLESLLDRGFSARLESTLVPISSAAWAAAVTGQGPGASGVYSFFESIPGSYDVRLISSRSLRAIPIWRTLSRRGEKSIVFGVPVTYPPEPIEGVMVAGMLAPPEGVYSWPAELSTELRARGFLPDLGAWRRAWTKPDDAVVEKQLRLKQQVLLELLESLDWRLAWIVFKSLDVLSHAGFDPDPGGSTAHHVERLDAVLGNLLQTVGAGTRVIVLSDHGFARHSRVFNLHAWLVEQGYALPRAATRRFPAAGRSIAESAPVQHRRRIDELDLQRTRAFATHSKGAYGGIRLNLEGRESRGSVARATRQALLDEIRQRLETLTTSDGGRLVREIVEGSKLYPGARSGALPDLLFAVRSDHLVLSSVAGPVLLDLPTPIADHAREGILAGAGPGIAHVPARLDVSIVDLAPTALMMMGIPPYVEMPGRVLVEVFENAPDFSRVSEAQDPPDLDAYREFSRSTADWTPDGESETRERLRALGYVE
jgi:predicted AlkP superfamily phosphohydrolase/phosphomutase